MYKNAKTTFRFGNELSCDKWCSLILKFAAKKNIQGLFMDKNFDDIVDNFFTQPRKQILNFDETCANELLEINQSFDKLQELQAKDISERIVKAEEQLEQLEHDLAEFLKA